MFYVQSVRNTLGSCVVWHGESGEFTSDLRKAKVFTKEEALMCRSINPDDEVWPKETIDLIAELCVFCEDLGEAE